MKFLYVSLMVLSVGYFLSCNKLIEEVRNSSIQKFANSTVLADSAIVNNYVWITGDQTMSGLDTSFRIRFLGSFTDSITHQFIAIQGIQVNTRNMVPAANHTFNFGYSDTSSTLAEGIALYGSTVKIKITGTSASDTLTKLVYMPKRMYKSPNDFPKTSILNSSNLIFNWPVDPLNASGLVAIKLWYNPGVSRFMSDSSLSSQNKVLTYIVSDNGTYTVPAADIQGFASKSYLTVTIGRVTEVVAVLPLSHKKVYYLATSSLSSDYVYVGCLPNWENIYPAVIRCQQANGLNTGHQEQQQKDIDFCSPSFNQTRYTDIGINLTACPLVSAVNGTNGNNIAYLISLTNQATSIVYQYTLSSNSTSVPLGSIPVGVYNVTINPKTTGIWSTFNLNSLQKDGTSAIFNGVTVNTGTTSIQIESNL